MPKSTRKRSTGRVSNRGRDRHRNHRNHHPAAADGTGQVPPRGLALALGTARSRHRRLHHPRPRRARSSATSSPTSRGSTRCSSSWSSAGSSPTTPHAGSSCNRIWCVITRHRVRACLVEMRTLNYSGNLPFIFACLSTKTGQVVWLWMRPGLSMEDLDNKAETLASACWARTAVIDPLQAQRRRRADRDQPARPAVQGTHRVAAAERHQRHARSGRRRRRGHGVPHARPRL